MRRLVGPKRVKRGGWDRHAIAAEVKRRGSTLTRVAEEAGLEPSACRVALKRRHSAGELALARYLGLPVSVLWPDRFSPGRDDFHTPISAAAASLNEDCSQTPVADLSRVVEGTRDAA